MAQYYKLLIFLASAAVVLVLPAIVMSVTEETEITVSNATIQTSVAISLSANLTSPQRITFGTIDPGTNDYNATHNNDSTGGNTSMWIVVSGDSNVDVDLCIKANESMKATPPYEIELGNYTWNGSIQNTSTSNWANNTRLPGTVISTTLAKVEWGIPTTSDQYVYFRFWLDGPPGQQAEQYVNQIEFKATQANGVC